MITILTDH